MAENYKPVDLLALVVVVGYFILIVTGKSSQVDFAFNSIIGFYFGHKVTENAKNL